ncbi:MAG: hypothetical protein GY950_37575 [bacterium]|nr:hypothetical protein [bacterium]
MIVLDNDGKPLNGITGFDTLRRDYDDLKRCMQIRDIREAVFRCLAAAKEYYKEDIGNCDVNETGKPGQSADIIYLDGGDKRLKEYVDFMLENPDVREMMLDEFYTILKPIYGEEG